MGRIQVCLSVSVVFMLLYPYTCSFAGVQTIDDVQLDSSLRVAFGKNTERFRKHYFQSLNEITEIGKSGYGENVCQSYVAYSLVFLMSEVVNMADVNASLFLVASTKAWKENSVMQGVGNVVKPMLMVEREVFDYVGDVSDKYVKDARLLDIVKNTRREAKELVDAWPFKDRPQSRKDGPPLANKQNEYGELGKVSIETMRLFRSIADTFDPSKSGLSMNSELCGESLHVFSETKGLSVRVVNVMSMVMLWGVSQYYSWFPEVKGHEKYAKVWLEMLLPAFEGWNQKFQEIGERTSDPVIRKAAVEYGEQYRKWRKALEAALATDGLSLPAAAQQ